MISNRLKKNKIFFLITAVLITVTLVYFLVIKKNSNGLTEKYGKNFSIIYIGNEIQNPVDIKNTYHQYIKEATDFWNDVLLEENVMKIEIILFSEPPTEYMTILAKGASNSRTNLKSGGHLLINTEAEATNWTDVFKHEIAHIMGIGTNIFWINGVMGYKLDGIKFPISLQEYKDNYNGENSDTLIPLSRDKGHFSEGIFDKELMTPYSDAPDRQPVTKLTLGALVDLGWRIDLNKAEKKD